MRAQKKQLNAATQALQQAWTYLEAMEVPADMVRERSAVFVRELSHAGSPIRAYVKIYAYKNNWLASIFRPAKSRTEVRNLLFFRSIGIPTPKIIAWGVQRSAIGCIVREFIITEAVADAEQLDKFVPRHCADQHEPEQKKMRLQIAQSLGQWTAAMHAERFVHGDLKWRNILARAQPGQPELFWIDCPRGRFAGAEKSFARKKLKDCATLDKIAHLECAKAERMAFIRAYLGESAAEPAVAELCHRVVTYRRKRFDPKDEKQRKDAQKNQ